MIFVYILALCATQNLSAANLSAIVPESMTRSVCEAWLKVIVAQDNDWAGAEHPFVLSVHELQDGDRVVGRYYRIDPGGYVIVSARRLSPPIKAYDEVGGSVFDSESGIAAMARDDLARTVTRYEALLAEGDMEALDEIDALLEANTARWEQLTGTTQTPIATLAKSLEPTQEIGPLLTSEWDQGFPYNYLCPRVGDERCPAGCVATATAQLMYYWKWPYAGRGGHSYYWERGGRILAADFSDPYAWELMGNKWGAGWSGASEDAVAELTYEVAVALEMAFGPAESSAYTRYILTSLPKFFRYSPDLSVKRRDRFTATEWLGIIEKELGQSAPLIYDIHRHVVVCDGFRLRGQSAEVHMNYGWGGDHNAWYVPDEHFCPRKDGSPDCYVDEDGIIVNIRPMIDQEFDLCATVSPHAGSRDRSFVLHPGDSAEVNITWMNRGVDVYRLNAAYESLTPGLIVTTGRFEVATYLRTNAALTLDAAAVIQLTDEISTASPAQIRVLSSASNGAFDVDRNPLI